MTEKAGQVVAVESNEAHDVEAQEWIESLEYVLASAGGERVAELISKLVEHAHRRRIRLPPFANTPYVNSIALSKQAPFPGDREIERRIKSIIRWNAMAMVVRANKISDGIGGHISTYASAATLLEIGFNHFFRATRDDETGDQIFFQGHASPGVYARAFVEGRLSEEQITNFRRELAPGGGLSSYPHPWLMPAFWEFPTVSMGLGPLSAIYQARFNRYLQDRGIKDTSKSHVWCFIGDGETDEPETLGAITLPVREKLDNLIFVINCNLQRLDGPVRGNYKIIQELEVLFRGAGWNVIKLIWGSEWDKLLERDVTGLLQKRMGEAIDGDYQKYSVETGAYIREHFFGKYPELLELVADMSDEQLQQLGRGGHDPAKVYAAYKQAIGNTGRPTVILAKTIKGYGLGEAGEGRNVTHQQKKLNELELATFRTRFNIPISDEEVVKAPFYRPAENSPEMEYLRKRREALGGFMPSRKARAKPLRTPDESLFSEFYAGTEGREVSTTMVFVRILTKLLKDPELGKFIVPIIPDEGRTFGMESLFRAVGIYSHMGQLYEPVDAASLLYYREATDGQILEEGITEAGSMSSFIAAGTAYATHGVNMIPFFTYYSMFGFQRIGDQMWLAGDIRAKGFLLGGTAGRTTLNGEGLQHEDGHSHLIAMAIPNLKAYDPAFAYEVSVIIRDGIYRMYEKQEDIFYYITIMNENYAQPPMPEGVKEGILKGMYCFSAVPPKKNQPVVNLLGSGTILNEVIAAGKLLGEKWGVAVNVWSVTSYKALHEDGMETDRWNMLHPEHEPRKAYVTQLLEAHPGPVVASSDYVKALPDMINRWIPGGLHALGTDGFGRSETRKNLRDFFEVDHRYVALAALIQLAAQGKVAKDAPAQAIAALGIDPEKLNPLRA